MPETQWAERKNGAQMRLVAGAERERGHTPDKLPGEYRSHFALGVKRPSSLWLRWERMRGLEVMLLAARVLPGVAVDSPPNRF